MDGIIARLRAREAMLESTKQKTEDEKRILEDLVGRINSLERDQQNQLNSTSSAARARRAGHDIEILDLDIDQQIEDLNEDIEARRKKIESLEGERIGLENDIKNLNEQLMETK